MSQNTQYTDQEPKQWRAVKARTGVRRTTRDQNSGVTQNNSWLGLPRGSCILPIDLQRIVDFNRGKTPAKRVALNLLPEPFIGNPCSARVVLLGLNPGHSDNDHDDQHNREFREAIRLNLRHKPQAYPFYPLDPRFANTGSGKWWQTHLRPLVEEAGLNVRTLSERLMVIEWFPYHSARSGLPPQLICESQKYSFSLAKKLFRRGLPVIGMRSREHWALADERLIRAQLRIPAIVTGRSGRT